MHDWYLLRQYVKHNSQTAFSQLVNRYINLVYATSRREVGDAALADDVTQVVFLTLARRAPMLMPDTVLSRWLFTAARLTARDVLKQERRRRVREMKASRDLHTGYETDHGDLSLDPAVNVALASLSAGDWEAVYLRFYEEMSLAEIGRAFGISEDTAQKRVSRALRRLRSSLTASGIGVSLAVEEILRTESARAAPEACAQSVLQGSLSSGTDTLSALTTASNVQYLARGVLKTMYLKNALATGVAVVVGVSGVSMAPFVGKTLRGTASTTASGPQSRVVSSVPSAAKPSFVADVKEYNRRWADIYNNLALYSDPKVVYKTVKFNKNQVVIRAHAPNMQEVGSYLKTIYHDPDFTNVSVDRMPGYPEATVKTYRLDGKLISVRNADGTKSPPPLVPQVRARNGKRVTESLKTERVYTVREVLKKQLASAHSRKQKRQIIRHARRRVQVKTEPKGFWVTITANLKQPLLPPGVQARP